MLMTKYVLCLFNTSDYAAVPWLCRGVDVVSVDLQNVNSMDMRREGTHFRIRSEIQDVEQLRRVLALHGFGIPSVVISFPPCTDLTSAGARHWKAKREANPDFQNEAVALARIAEGFGVPYVVENPVGALSTLWRKPDVWTHPYEWSGYCPPGEHPEAPELYPSEDRYCKKTGLWYGNGFKLPVTIPVEPEDRSNPGWAKLGGKSARTKYLRSLTPRGLAEAFYCGNWREVLL